VLSLVRSWLQAKETEIDALKKPQKGLKSRGDTVKEKSERH